jgi:hypothetical protein
LYHSATIVPVGKRAEINSEEQERRPVADHGKAGEHRRMEFLIEQPVADHMLDIVAHRRE